jgi:hypothetical protein
MGLIVNAIREEQHAPEEKKVAPASTPSAAASTSPPQAPAGTSEKAQWAIERDKTRQIVEKAKEAAAAKEAAEPAAFAFDFADDAAVPTIRKEPGKVYVSCFRMDKGTPIPTSLPAVKDGNGNNVVVTDFGRDNLTVVDVIVVVTPFMYDDDPHEHIRSRYAPHHVTGIVVRTVYGNRLLRAVCVCVCSGREPASVCRHPVPRRHRISGFLGVHFVQPAMARHTERHLLCYPRGRATVCFHFSAGIRYQKQGIPAVHSNHRVSTPSNVQDRDLSKRFSCTTR